MVALLILIRDDSARIAARGFRSAHFEIVEKVTLTRVANLDHLIVFDSVLVAVRADAPDMHGEDLAVLVEGNADDALLPALRPEDLDDIAIVLDRAAVGCDGVGGFIEENDGVGLGGIDGEFLLRGGAYPIGNTIRFERDRRSCDE